MMKFSQNIEKFLYKAQQIIRKDTTRDNKSFEQEVFYKQLDELLSL